MEKKKDSPRIRHYLVGDAVLFKKIEDAQKKYHPYLHSRNAFICELILLEISKLGEIKKGE